MSHGLPHFRAAPPGPPLRGYRPPAPYPEVYLPHQRPYFYHPFMPYYVAPNYLPPYIGRKDLRMLNGMGSRALVPVASSAPDRGPLPQDLGQYVDSHHYTHVSEAWWDDLDTLGDDDDDLLGGIDFDDEDAWFGAEGKKKRPFELVSKLFEKLPGKKHTKADELIHAAKVLSKGQLPATQQQPPPPQGWTGGQVAAGAAAAIGLIGLGVFASRAMTGA